MEEHLITITVRTKGEVCELTDAEIKQWYETSIDGLFNPEYGTPEISVEVKRIPQEVSSGIPCRIKGVRP